MAQPEGAGHVRPDGHVLLAWLHGGTSADYRGQVAQLPGVSVLAPTWWALDGADLGGISDRSDPAFVAWARERGLAVWPQLSNRLDADLTDAVLADPARRARLVETAAAAVQGTGAGGLIVGFENLHDRSGPALTAFVGELRAALPDRTVAVTVAPLTDTWSRGSWSTAYERRPLGEIADYVVLAALDQHDDATRPGPVAGLDWTLEAVEQLLRSVPDRKVLLSVPLYARSWAEHPGGAVVDATLGMTAMQRRLDEAEATHEFDAAAGQRRYTHTGADGRLRRTWQEDTASLARRAQLATTYNLAGIAGWRAGLAGPEAWEALSATLAAQPRPPGAASGPPRLNRLVPPPRVAGPQPQTAAGRPREVLSAAEHSNQRAGPLAVSVATVLLAVVTAGLVGQRSSRRTASSALSSPPTSIDSPDR